MFIIESFCLTRQTQHITKATLSQHEAKSDI